MWGKAVSSTVGCSSSPSLPSPGSAAVSHPRWKWRQSAQCGIRGDRLSFSSAFACHLRKRSSGLSGDDTISLGTVPPCSGMYRYSGIQMDRGCLPPPPPPLAEPGLSPDCRASSGGAAPAKSSAPLLPRARIPAPARQHAAEGRGELRDSAIHPRAPGAAQGGGEAGGAALHNARQDGEPAPGRAAPQSSAALALPDANVPLWRRSARPCVLFGSVGTCGRASLSSSHTGCGADTAGVKILGL